MKKFLQFIGAFLMFVALYGLYIGFIEISSQDKQIHDRVYSLLEEDVLTQEEKEFIEFATNPDEMKDGFVALDKKHRELYKRHFGYHR